MSGRKMESIISDQNIIPSIPTAPLSKGKSGKNPLHSKLSRIVVIKQRIERLPRKIWQESIQFDNIIFILWSHMSIAETKNSRYYLPEIGDRATVGKKHKPMGFRQHNCIVGWFLSCMGLAFEDTDAGWLNKESVKHYLQRNSTLFDITDAERTRIINLDDDSTANDVHDLFILLKTKPRTRTPHLARGLEGNSYFNTRGPYIVNPQTVQLQDGHSTYPAEPIQFLPDAYNFIIAADPSDELEKNYFYEMAWALDLPLLVSLVDKDTTTHLTAPGDNLDFNATTGVNLKGKCWLNEPQPEIGEERRFILGSAYGIRSVTDHIILTDFTTSIKEAHSFYKYIKKDVFPEQSIMVCCKKSKTSIACALILWTQIFYYLDKGKIKIEDITWDYLTSLCKPHQNWIQSYLNVTKNFYNDTQLQAMIKEESILFDIHNQGS